MAEVLELNKELVHGLQGQAMEHNLPWQQWALLILAQAIDRPDDAASWQQSNRRRLDLIHRKYQTGLNEAEQAELTTLTAVADRHLEKFDRARLEWLRPFEELAENLQQQTNE